MIQSMRNSTGFQLEMRREWLWALVICILLHFNCHELNLFMLNHCLCYCILFIVYVVVHFCLCLKLYNWCRWKNNCEKC